MANALAARLGGANGEIVIEEVVMTATMHEPCTAGQAREGIAARLLAPAFRGAVSIIAMWLANLFEGSSAVT